MPEIFLCIVCKNDFSNWWNLRKHIFSHLPQNDKRFKCSSCSYATTQKFTAKRHIINRHNNMGEVIEIPLSLETLEEHKRLYTESQRYTRQQHILNNPDQILPPTPQVIVIQPKGLNELDESLMKPRIIIRPAPQPNQNVKVKLKKIQTTNDSHKIELKNINHNLDASREINIDLIDEDEDQKDDEQNVDEFIEKEMKQEVKLEEVVLEEPTVDTDSDIEMLETQLLTAPAAASNKVFKVVPKQKVVVAEGAAPKKEKSTANLVNLIVMSPEQLQEKFEEEEILEDGDEFNQQNLYPEELYEVEADELVETETSRPASASDSNEEEEDYFMVESAGQLILKRIRMQPIQQQAQKTNIQRYLILK